MLSDMILMNSLLSKNLVMYVKVLWESEECRNFHFSNTFFMKLQFLRKLFMPNVWLLKLLWNNPLASMNNLYRKKSPQINKYSCFADCENFSKFFHQIFIILLVKQMGLLTSWILKTCSTIIYMTGTTAWWILLCGLFTPLPS